MKISFKVLKDKKTWNIEDLAKVTEKNVKLALEESAIKVHSDSVHLAPVAEYLGGTLRGSLGYSVDGGPIQGSKNPSESVQQSKPMEALIGTNLEYAAYVEFGTGKYYPGGRSTPWIYRDPKTGKFYKTSGMPAQPFLRPAFDNNEQQIRQIFKKYVKKSIKEGG